MQDNKHLSPNSEEEEGLCQAKVKRDLQNLEKIGWSQKLGYIKRKVSTFQGMFSVMFLRTFQTRTGKTFDAHLVVNVNS